MELIPVAYYITGHGLGHATRSLELIRGLLLTKRFKVLSISNVPATFFLQELQHWGVPLLSDLGESLYSHYERNLDTGAVQKDVIHMDTLSTLERYFSVIHTHREDLLRFESEWLQSHHVKLVLLDATPLGSMAGRLAGAKVVFVTNFTWDFIFRTMFMEMKDSLTLHQDVDMIEKYEKLIKVCEEDVCACNHIIRYPGATPLPASFNKEAVISGPLISRPVRDFDLRSRLCGKEEKLLLLGFGGHAVDWHLDDGFLPVGWKCVVLRADTHSMPSDRFVVAPPDAYIPDYIHAADVVLGKIGYGFVSECLVGGTPLIYVPRIGWPEEDYLEVVLTKDFDAGVAMSLEDFEKGRWGCCIKQALEKKGGWTLPLYQDKNGKQISATEKVIELLEDCLRIS